MAHGPKPRSLPAADPEEDDAARAASARCRTAPPSSKVVVVDRWAFDAPRTKDAVDALGALGLRTAGERPPRVLLVLDRTDDVAWKSFRNLGDRVQIILPEELNAYDVLVNDWLVFSSATLEAIVSRLTDGAAARRPTRGADAIAGRRADAADG